MISMRIVSHNAFWFQGHPYPGDDPDSPHPGIFSELSALYKGLGPSVLCVQEVESKASFVQLRDTLGMSGSYCEGGVYPQYGGAILWRAGEAGDNTFSTAPRFQRVWQIAKVCLPGGTTIRVCNLHLASARFLGDEGGSEARRRDIENLLLHEHDPEVIAGDFNEPPGGSVEQVLVEEGYIDAARITGVLPDSTGINKQRSDQIWVHRSIADWVEGFGMIDFDALRTSVDGKVYLSDHCPLWMDLNVER